MAYKAQACQIIGMMAEEGSINHLLNENNAINNLTDCMLYQDLIVKRNAAESLAFLIKDETSRNLIKDDRPLHVARNEFSKRSD